MDPTYFTVPVSRMQTQGTTDYYDLCPVLHGSDCRLHQYIVNVTLVYLALWPNTKYYIQSRPVRIKHDGMEI